MHPKTNSLPNQREYSYEKPIRQTFRNQACVFLHANGNYIVTFNTKSGADNFATQLQTKGVTSTKNPGQKKSAQLFNQKGKNSFGIVLTPDDMRKLGIQPSTPAQRPRIQVTKPVQRPQVAQQATLEKHPKADEKTYSSSIEGISAFSLAEVSTPQFATKRRDLFSLIEQAHQIGLPKETTENQKTVQVFYDSSADGLTPAVVKNTLHLDSHADPANQASAWRHLTKHRIVTSDITAYKLDRGRLGVDFPFTMTTVATSNFMGSSAIDEQTYIQNGSLNARGYKDTLKLILKRALKSQDDQAVKVVVLPAIGIGVYIKKLSPADQVVARQMFGEALSEVLQDSQFRHIEEVVCALPDEKDDSQNAAWADVTSACAGVTLKTNLVFANVDVFAAAKKVADQGKKVGILNAGSDRTMGGIFTQLKGTTFEEMLFNRTNAAWVQSCEHNPSLNDQNKYAAYGQNQDADLCVTQWPSIPKPRVQTRHSTSSVSTRQPSSGERHYQSFSAHRKQPQVSAPRQSHFFTTPLLSRDEKTLPSKNETVLIARVRKKVQALEQEITKVTSDQDKLQILSEKYNGLREILRSVDNGSPLITAVNAMEQSGNYPRIKEGFTSGWGDGCKKLLKDIHAELDPPISKKRFGLC